MKRPSRPYRESGPSIIVAAVSIAALYLGRVVFIPLTFALLFSLILTPIVSFLEKIKFPRLLAIFVVVLTLLGATSLIGWISSVQVVDLSNELPSYAQALQKKINATQSRRSVTFTRLSQTVKEIGRELVEAIPGSPAEQTKPGPPPAPGSSAAHPLSVSVVAPENPIESITNMIGPMVNVLVVAVFTIFILVGREDLRDRLIKLVAGGRRLNLMTRALDETTQRINKYLLLQLVVNAIYGLLVGVALHFIGVPNAALWGMVATVLRFLPYLGPPMAAVIPILISVAIFPGFLHALAAIAFYLALELLVGNIIEPVVYGAHVGLSPLAILVAAIFWTLVWGFPGLLLSTPLTVCLVVIGRYSPTLGFLNTILGDEPVLPPQAQFYQRLLAAEQGDARQILDRYRTDHSLEDTYSSLLLPALSLAEQDRHRNELDEDSETFIYQSARELVDELGEASEARPAPGLRVLCIPAKDDADAIAAIMLCQLLVAQGFDARSVPVTTSASILRHMRTTEPSVICLSALPPFAMENARSLYAKLRARFPEPRIIICFWQFEGDIQKLTARFKLTAGDRLLTTLPEVLAQVTAQQPELTQA